MFSKLGISSTVCSPEAEYGREQDVRKLPASSCASCVYGFMPRSPDKAMHENKTPRLPDGRNLDERNMACNAKGTVA